MSAKKSADKKFANSKINEYNSLVQNLAKEKGVYYLNVAEAFKDKNGNPIDIYRQNKKEV